MTETQATKLLELLNNINISTTFIEYALLGVLITFVVYIIVKLIKGH